jgi:hypothetical protein
MNKKNQARAFLFLSAALFLLSFRNVIVAQRPSLPPPSLQSPDLIKNGNLAREYKGIARLPDGLKYGTLTIREDFAGTNFILQVTGESPIKGRIAGYFAGSKTAYASLKIFENAESLGTTESRAVSLQLLKTDRGITLMKGRETLFETGPCPDYPYCRNISGCSPCVP